MTDKVNIPHTAASQPASSKALVEVLLAREAAFCDASTAADEVALGRDATTAEEAARDAASDAADAALRALFDYQPADFAELAEKAKHLGDPRVLRIITGSSPEHEAVRALKSLLINIAALDYAATAERQLYASWTAELRRLGAQEETAASDAAADEIASRARALADLIVAAPCKNLAGFAAKAVAVQWALNFDSLAWEANWFGNASGGTFCELSGRVLEQLLVQAPR